MKKNLLLLSVFLLGTCFSIIAQEAAQKAKIYIKKSENGNVTEIEEEIPITEGADLEKMLNELGIWEDFENLTEGETIELNIRRFENGDWMNALEMAFTGQENPQAFLGVMIRNAENDGKGVRITEIIDDTAASGSELKEGDVILEIDSQETNSTEQLIDIIQTKQVGEEVSVRYSRDGKVKKTKIQLGENQTERMNYFDIPRIENFNFDFPEMESFDFPENLNWMECNQEKAFLGVSPSPEHADSGVRLGAITQASAAEEMGLQTNDIIRSINGEDISSFSELADFISTLKPGTEIEIIADRDGKSINFSGALGSRNFGNNENIHFFRDYKGVDENGDMIFNFEFDMEGDSEMNLEELEKLLGDQEVILEQFQINLDNSSRRLDVTIEIGRITEEEAALVNENAQPALRIEDDLKMDNFSFYPNPSAGQFNLQFDLAQKGGLDIFIYDQTGSVIYSERISGFSGKYNKIIDLSQFEDGLYFMQIMQDNKSFSKKLIKG